MDYTILASQPTDIRAYIAQRANRYNLNPQTLFDKIPNHLKDNPKEIMDYLSENHGDSIGMQISHIKSQANFPELANDPNNVIFETTQGSPNQIRGSRNMTSNEVDQILWESDKRALEVEIKYPEDNSISYSHQGNYTPNYEEIHQLALNNNNEALADAIHDALNGIANTAGLALTYAVARVYIPKIIGLIQFIVKHRTKLIQSYDLRQKLVSDYVLPMLKSAPNEIGPAFIVGLLLVCIPGLRELLLAYGLTAICKLALENIRKFVFYIERYVPNLARMLHWVISGGQKLINAINSLLGKLWKVVEKVASAAWNTVKAGVQQVGKVAKDCLSTFFKWSWNKLKSIFHNKPKLYPA